MDMGDCDFKNGDTVISSRADSPLVGSVIGTRKVYPRSMNLFNKDHNWVWYVSVQTDEGVFEGSEKCWHHKKE